MFRRQPRQDSQPHSATRSVALVGLASAAAVVILWSLFETRSKQALAAERPLARENPGRRQRPLLSAEVTVETARSKRTPVQLTNTATTAPVLARPDPMDRVRSFLCLSTSRTGKGGSTDPVQVSELQALKDTLDPDSLKRLCALALEQLRDDDIRWNANQAIHLLKMLDGAHNPVLRPLLLDCLNSVDLQQRSLVARFLRASEEAAEEKMLLAAAKDLRDDVVPKPHKSLAFKGYPEGKGYWNGLRLPHDLHNARQATRMLIDEGPRAWPHVLKRLHASDPQERFLAAVILARTRCTENLDLTVTVLVTHLKDNDWKGDAIIAGRALHELGEAALPHLRRLRSIADPQGRRLVRLAIEDIEEPSSNASEAYERAQKIAPSAEGKPLAVWRFAPDSLDGLVRR